MEYQKSAPVLSGNGAADCERLLGYIEDIKAETAIKISYLERVLEVLKKEVSV